MVRSALARARKGGPVNNDSSALAESHEYGDDVITTTDRGHLRRNKGKQAATVDEGESVPLGRFFSRQALMLQHQISLER